MSAREERGQSRLIIEITPEFRRRIEAAAAERGITLRGDVVAALHEALEQPQTERSSDDREEWSRLSVASFARDWDSDADAIDDDLA